MLSIRNHDKYKDIHILIYGNTNQKKLGVDILISNRLLSKEETERGFT